MTWYDSDYGYKKKITIDYTKVAGDEIDFPILISVTDDDLRDEANGGRLKNSNGYDIIFTNAAENTQLKHGIERYVNTNGLLVFWVKIPSLSSTVATEFYIYYSKIGVITDPSSTDTWDSNFLGVYHLNESLGSICYDSTVNSNDGTYNGNLPNRQTGKIGYGQDLDGNGDDISLPSGVHSPLALTYEIWYEADSNTADEALYANWQDSNNYVQLILKTNTYYNFVGAYSGSNQFDIYAGSRTTNWEHYGASFQTNDAILIVNSAIIGTDNSVSPQAFNFVGSVIGNNYLDSGDADGVIDEVRISNVRRSNNWLNTSYETQNDPVSFMSWGSEESGILRHVTSDIINISDNVIYKHSLNLIDTVDIVDSISLNMRSICGSLFNLHSNTHDIYLPMPDWVGESGTLNNDVKLFDFWTGERDTVNIGISSEPITLNGVVFACTDDEIAEMAAIAVTFSNIHATANAHEEIIITGLGNCYDAVYVIKNFKYNTIRRSPYAYSWQLTLEYVRAI